MMATQTLTPPPADHNGPPPLTPLEEAREALSLLWMEATNWLDGAPIENEAQAAEVARLIDAARKARTAYDNARKAEKKPHDDAAKAVDATWKPILSDLERISDAGKGAQTPWLVKLDAEKRAKEEAARKEAEAKIAEARRLAAEADGSLAAAKARDAAIEDAKRAEAAAAFAAKQTAGAKGEGMARKVSLRSTWKARVSDRRELLGHIAKNDPEGLEAFTLQWAQQAVRAGARTIPGCEVIEEKVAA